MAGCVGLLLGGSTCSVLILAFPMLELLVTSGVYKHKGFLSFCLSNVKGTVGIGKGLNAFPT